MDSKAKIALSLLQINAIQLRPQNPFTWASGIKSPIYCDNRIALSYPMVRRLILDGFLEKLSTASPPVEVIAGVATAGIPWASFIALESGLPLVYVRSEAKSHGRQNAVEGKVEPGQKVLLVEDLISTGGSSLKALHNLREHQADVTGLVAIFQYGFAEALENFHQAQCPFTTLTDYSTLINQAYAEGLIHNADLQLLNTWRLNPHQWPQHQLNVL